MTNKETYDFDYEVNGIEYNFGVYRDPYIHRNNDKPITREEFEKAVMDCWWNDFCFEYCGVDVGNGMIPLNYRSYNDCFQIAGKVLRALGRTSCWDDTDKDGE